MYSCACIGVYVKLVLWEPLGYSQHKFCWKHVWWCVSCVCYGVLSLVVCCMGHVGLPFEVKESDQVQDVGFLQTFVVTFLWPVEAILNCGECHHYSVSLNPVKEVRGQFSMHHNLVMSPPLQPCIPFDN